MEEMKKDFSNIKSVLATDCGSTTTKAILIEKRGDEYRLIVRGEAPTTVEAPFEDVTKGVLNAIMEVEDLVGRKILDGDRIITPQQGNVGVDAYISTSSAGGGLQMMVAGVIRSMTAESAARAALGAGAIVLESIASNDGRMPHEKIEVIRQLRPDMILLAGGVDGGTKKHIIELAELIASANPKPRLGIGYKLPLIYAGNQAINDKIQEILSEKTDLHIVPNVRPTLDTENLQPARDKIHDLFMEHVMAQAPGYKKLMSWTDAPIMPTPGAVGLLIQTIARNENINVVGVDIGGATTDVFSVFDGQFNRTVSANLGMSYSISNVLAEAGIKNILRWVPFDVDEVELRNRIGNKMIRPTTVPHLLDDLKVEQAIAREALRLAFIQHKQFAVELKGVQRLKTITETFSQEVAGKTLVNMLKLDMIVGSGGVLSHAPRRSQAAMMMIDAFLPEGITELTVDSIFMMPHLGVLSTLNERAATEVFEKDCLIRLGYCIAPVGNSTYGKPCLDVEIKFEDGNIYRESIKFGELKLIPVPIDKKVQARFTPMRGFNMGEGNKVPVERELHGGVVGLIIDCRGRPLRIPEDKSERLRLLKMWFDEMGLYPDQG